MKCSRVGNNSRGFTIVELLIVVVVIAILAAITIVAYNGIRQRAENSAQQSELSQLQRKIQVEVLRDTGEPVSIKAPITYVEGSSVAKKLFTPLVAAQQITMYGVFDTVNNTTAANWSTIISLSPTDMYNALRLRTGASGSSSGRGFYATDQQTNNDLTQNNVLNTTARHVGWISTNGTSIQSGYDAGTQNAGLTVHNGFDFDTINLYSNASYTSVAALVFDEYHDVQTRQKIVAWLAQRYTVTP